MKHKEAAAALKKTPCEVVIVESFGQLSRKRSSVAPRLAIIEASTASDHLTEILGLLRKTWPLMDTIVWAPRASAGTTRSAFLAGAKDVVISNSLARLTQTVEEILHSQQFLPLADELATKRSRASRFESMLSRSNHMWDLFDTCARVAPSEATVLIVGETGTGKELLARAIHHRSQRSGRFVATNCASITPDLIESELFGYEAGAFTGAQKAKLGLVRHADKGTLFLDEIGDMPESAQMSLLRLLQEGKVRPVGGYDEVAVDVRILAATHVSLDDAVAEGAFREDLLYRLDVIRLNVPPLRERPEDIVYLFGHFLKKLSKHYGLPRPEVADSFLEAMTAYAWSGNIRQLENFAERVVLAAPRRRLGGKDFTRLIQHSHAEPASPAPNRTVRSLDTESALVDTGKTLEEHVVSTVKQLEREYLEAVLRQNQGRIGETANAAGISRRTLLRKLKSFGVDKSDFK